MTNFGLETSARERDAAQRYPEVMARDGGFVARLARDVGRLLSLQRWQPMETAPRDGTRFAGWPPEEPFPSSPGWSQEHPLVVDLIWEVDRAVKQAAREGGRYDTVIRHILNKHLPLPNPPTQKGGGSDSEGIPTKADRGADTTQPRPSDDQAGGAPDIVTLEECPIGLFRSVETGTLCLKTEYGNNDGRIDAFIVETGEFFWGTPPQTIASQRQQKVRPVDIGEIRSSGIQEGLERAAKIVERRNIQSGDYFAAAIRASGDGR